MPHENQYGGRHWSLSRILGKKANVERKRGKSHLIREGGGSEGPSAVIGRPSGSYRTNRSRKTRPTVDGWRIKKCPQEKRRAEEPHNPRDTKKTHRDFMDIEQPNRGSNKGGEPREKEGNAGKRRASFGRASKKRENSKRWDPGVPNQAIHNT